MGRRNTGTDTGRRGREGFAKDAKEIEMKIFLCLLSRPSRFFASFASLASGQVRIQELAA
jgi:hypothetical protein